MHSWLQKIFASFIQTGTLRVTTAGGQTFVLGDGSGKPVAVRFTTIGAELGVLLDPELRLGEAFMDGTFLVEEGTIADFIALALSQKATGNLPKWAQPQWLARRLWYRLKQLNIPGRTRRPSGARPKVAHQYDLDGAFYSLFLDADQQLSWAYFETPDQSLEQAQLSKKRHLAAKLLLKPGSRVLDIGSGWGGLAFYLAEIGGARVTGVTPSEEQVARSKARADERGLVGSVQFRRQDYRDVTGVFDRIVSVEMIDNIGRKSYDTFFRKCAELMTEDGVFLLHAVGRREGTDTSSPFIAKYFSPDVYAPVLAELLPPIERAGLLVTDIEIMQGAHCARTLSAWRERFLARREEVERLYDPRFFRMWEFWFTGAEISVDAALVFQIQMTKRQGVVPITRDYIGLEEARLRGVEGGRRPPLTVAGE
jgi:cyclopropane-fatty-acyl-phospholipid synthase